MIIVGCHNLFKLKRSQVAEKCPMCGHMEAYSKEMQVCILIFQNREEITVIAAKECR